MSEHPPSAGAWPMLPERPELRPGEVHLCRFGLEEPGADARILLSPDERERLDRTRNPEAARVFLAGRSTLRRILGRYLGCDPGVLTFAYSEAGKPTLASPVKGKCLHFNLTHDDRIALAALDIHDPVGIDAESLHRPLDWEPIARRYLAPAEYASVIALEESRRRRAFLEIWVVREAYAKATGLGLSKTLGELRNTNSGFDALGDEGWKSCTLNTDSGHIVAVVTKGPKTRIRYDF